MRIERTFDIIELQLKLYPQKTAFSELSGQSWRQIGTQEAIDKIEQLAIGLHLLGLKKGDYIAIVPGLANIDWILLDYAAMQLGILVVPIHVSSDSEQFAYILAETKSKIVIFEHQDSIQKFRLSLKGLDQVQYHTQSAFISELLDLAKDKQTLSEAIEHIKSGISPDDICTIIYTSGSSGEPKGVLLSHKNICSNLLALLPLVPVDNKDVALSFLPFSHIFERMALYAYTSLGLSIRLVSNRENLQYALQSAKPDIFSTVPRILEKMYELLLLAKAQSPKPKKLLIDWALSVGKNNLSSSKPKLIQHIKTKIAYLLVYRNFKKKLGGKVKYIIVGAAALQPKLGALFSSLGIKIREGYGMTETAPVISINRFTPGMNMFSTVGIPLPGIQVKIDSPNENGEGEILVKGDNVMVGYLNKPILTKYAFAQDGWFKTGDIGTFVSGRFLKITDRKKDIFKTTSGKYVAPLMIENKLKNAAMIEQCMVIGFNKPFVSALIMPCFPLLEQWCIAEDIHWTSPQYMVHNIKVKAHIERFVEDLNSTLPNYSKIKSFSLFHEPWTIEGGELTYTLKLKRDVIVSKFEKGIAKMYAETRV